MLSFRVKINQLLLNFNISCKCILYGIHFQFGKKINSVMVLLLQAMFSLGEAMSN